MHRSSTATSRGATSRLVFLALLGVLLVLALAQAVPAFAASTFFDGGPVAADTATMVANDHTVYAFRFSNTDGGTYPIPDGEYYVKVRFTPNADGSPAGVDNRGFTWNPTSSSWVQERSDWALFPTVTVTNGLITGGSSTGTSAWFYYKFGDTTKTGTYRLLLSLSSGVSGTTRNGSTTLPVTVNDPTTDAAWVHSGVSTTKTNGKRAVVVAHQDPADPKQVPVANERTELNNVDDDSDGMVDNEIYGPVQAGGFRMAVPTGQALDVALQDALWPAGSTGFTISVPDTDIAIGAADQTAPAAPGSLTGAPRDKGAVLTWTAAAGADGYVVYRWEDPADGSGYTSAPEKIADTTETTYTDSGLANDTVYHYLVRAVDAATNVGPRATTDVVPSNASTLTLSAKPTVINWGKPWALDATLADVAGAPIPDAMVDLQSSIDGGLTWVTLKSIAPAAGTSTYSAPVTGTNQKMKFRLRYTGDATHASAYSNPVTITPRVKLGKPVAPRAVKRGRKFTTYGSLSPRQPRGSKTVQLKCYLKKSGKWVLKKTVKAVNTNRGSASRYSAKFSLRSKGKWKIVAYSRATSLYAKTTSRNEFLRVK